MFRTPEVDLCSLCERVEQRAEYFAGERRGEGVQEARGGLAGVPGPDAPGGLAVPAGEVAAPDSGVKPEGEHHLTGRTVVLPGLGVLGPGVLLDLFEAALDGPAAGVTGGGLGSGGGQVGGDEEVVGLDAGRVADDDQADQGVLADLVPEHVRTLRPAGRLPGRACPR